MRLTCWLFASVAVVLAIAVPVPAQPGGSVKRLSDPLGRFTIEYPADWAVSSHVIEAGKVGTVFSGVSQRGYVDVSLGESSAPVSAEDFGRSVEAKRRKANSTYQQLLDGPTDLAGHRAYYVYYTITDGGIKYYCLRVYLVVTVQRASPSGATTYRGFWLDGGTRNDPQSVRDNVPLIQQIVWSFRPT